MRRSKGEDAMAKTRVLLLLGGVLFSVLGGCRVLQYNIGNGANPPREGHLDIIEMLHAGERPTVITLNEVCGLRFNQMRVTGERFGFSAAFRATNRNGCGGSNDGLGYGNAILVHGRILGEAYHYYDCQGQEDRPGCHDHGSSEDRNILCVTFDPANLGGRAMACTTHLQAGDVPVASAQAREALAFVTYLWDLGGRPPTVVGGDFNMTPIAPVIDEWRTSPFGLVSSATAPTHENNRTIDYLFASDTTPFSPNEVRGGRSDHHMVFANVWQ
jgi:endonuclease/exonuclease/phosphatase family metal-dependent hydrolase